MADSAWRKPLNPPSLFLFSLSLLCSIKKWMYNGTQWENTKTVSVMQGGKPNESIAVASLCALGSRYLVSASAKGVLKVWDAETCHPVEEHTQHEERVTDLSLSGATLVSASSDRTVKVGSAVASLWAVASRRSPLDFFSFPATCTPFSRAGTPSDPFHQVWEIQPSILTQELELARKAEQIAGAIAAAAETCSSGAAAESTFTMQRSSDDVGNRTFDLGTTPPASAAALPVAADAAPPSATEGTNQTSPDEVTYIKLDPPPTRASGRTSANTTSRFENEV